MTCIVLTKDIYYVMSRKINDETNIMCHIKEYENF